MSKTSKAKSINYRVFLTNRKSLAIAVSLAAFSVILVVFAIVPQFQEILKLNTELQKEKPRLEKLQQKLVELENVQFSPEFSQKEIVDFALPSKKPLLELLTSLNTIAVDNKVSISEFSLNPGLIATSAAEMEALSKNKSISDDGVDELQVEMVINGSFADVGSFLIDLEKISPFTTVKQLALSSQKSGDDFGTQADDMQAKITSSSYFFVQSVSAAVEAPLPTLNQREQEVLQELTAFSQFDLPEQLEITGGGLEDLFGVAAYEFE